MGGANVRERVISLVHYNNDVNIDNVTQFYLRDSDWSCLNIVMFHAWTKLLDSAIC